MKLDPDMRTAIHKAVDDIVAQATHLKDTGYAPGFITAAIEHAIGKMESDLRDVFTPKMTQEIIAEVRAAIEAQRMVTTVQ